MSDLSVVSCQWHATRSPFVARAVVYDSSRVGLARAAGYDGGMENNPYDSPQAIDDRPAIPRWRRALSMPLIFFGALFTIMLPFYFVSVAMGIVSLVSLPTVMASVFLLLSIAALWFGIRLRRRY